MFRRFALALLPVLIPLVASIPTMAVQDSDRKEKARAVLDGALQALGGLDRLQSLDSLFFRGKGSEFRSAELQGPDPDTPTRTFHEETVAVLPSQDRLLYEHRTGRHDGSFRWRRWIYAGERRTVIDLLDGLIRNFRDPSAPTERARLARTIPHLLLLEATKTPELNWVGSRLYAQRIRREKAFFRQTLRGEDRSRESVFPADS